MIDLDELKDYIIDLSNNQIDSIKNRYIRHGFDLVFENQINTFCNCEKLFSDGRRCTQTNDKRYKNEISSTIWLIENAIENNDDKEKYYNQLLERHRKNIEFEKINGFEYNPNKTNSKHKNKNVKAQSKTTKVLKTVKDKETASTLKLKKHAAKINTLTFKLKPINNDNII